MNRSHGTAVTLLLAAVTGLPVPAADDRFILIGDLPGSWDASWGNAVSGDGSVIVGGSWGASGYEAFVWTEGFGMVGLGELPGGNFYSTATGVSDDGSLIVGYTAVGNDNVRAVRWEGGPGPVEMPLCDGCPDPGCDTIAYGLSADGGRAVGLCGFIPTGDFQAVRWENGGVTALGQLEATAISPEGLALVGTDPGRTGWVWRDGEPKPTSIGELAPGGHSQPWAVSNDGNTVAGHAGIFVDGAYTEVPFVWTRDGGIRQIQTPGASPWGNAWGMAADGSRIVGASPCPECPGAFSAWIWDAESGARSLDEVAAEYGIELGNYHIAQALGISADGEWIVGSIHADEPGVFDLAMRIRLVKGCAADIDQSGALDLFDFLAFANLFNSADAGADCTADGVLDMFDFLCFVNAFNDGC